MKRLIQIFALALVLFPGSLAAEESKQTDQRVYDRYGNYQGRTDDRGRVYDRYGNYPCHVRFLPWLDSLILLTTDTKDGPRLLIKKLIREFSHAKTFQIC